MKAGFRGNLVGTWLAALVALLQSWPAAPYAAEVPVVATASDLQYVLVEVSETFTRDTGRAVKLSMGSSGNFTRQIMQGAPFELFFSADEGYVTELAGRGLTQDAGALYAVGRLALFVPRGSAVKADAQLHDLAASLADGRLRKLAIANPEHAPYGRAARQTLEKAGIWEKLQGRLVMGENVSQAAQFAATGSVEAALIAYSLAISGPMAGRGAYVLVPEEWHRPLRQRMVLLQGAGATARAFYAFVQLRSARAVFERYGFSLPQ